MKKWILLTLRLIVLLACVIFLIFKVDFNYLFNDVLRKLPLWLMPVSIIMSVFRIWLNGLRWKLINTDMTCQLSNWDYFRYMMISSSFNLVMPGSLGGDIIKAVWVGSDVTSNKTRNVLSIFFDRAIGFFSLFLLGLAAFSFSPIFSTGTKIIVWSIAFVLLVLLFFVVGYIKKGPASRLISSWKPKRNIFQKIKNALTIFKDIILFYLEKPHIFIFALLLSFAIHVSFFIINYLTALLLNIQISFLDLSMVTCLVWLITAVPVSISGIGVREISYISLLGWYGIMKEAAAGLSLYGFLISIIIGLLGLPFFLYQKKKISTGSNTRPF